MENREDPTRYHNIQTATLDRRDLDLVAIANDGAIAAFCTIKFDGMTRSAYFEPVAIVPAHQRRGLGKALMTEGLRRLQRMEAINAFLDGGSPARRRKGTDNELQPETWRKLLSIFPNGRGRRAR